MIAALKEYAGAAAVALMIVLLLAGAWLGGVLAKEEARIHQEQYNTAWSWCGNHMPDAESCRWGAFTALNPSTVVKNG